MPNYATVKAVTPPDSWPQASPGSGLKVAIFSDPEGGSTDAECIQATISILSTNSGYVPSTISAADIRAGGLAGYDMVMFPWAGGIGQATALQQPGRVKVAQFVADGGGYIRTCAGAYLAPLVYNTQTSWLELVNAQVIEQSTQAPRRPCSTGELTPVLGALPVREVLSTTGRSWCYTGTARNL